MESKILIVVDAQGKANVMLEGAAGESKKAAVAIMMDAARALLAQIEEPAKKKIVMPNAGDAILPLRAVGT